MVHSISEDKGLQFLSFMYKNNTEFRIDIRRQMCPLEFKFFIPREKVQFKLPRHFNKIFQKLGLADKFEKRVTDSVIPSTRTCVAKLHIYGAQDKYREWFWTTKSSLGKKNFEEISMQQKVWVTIIGISQIFLIGLFCREFLNEFLTPRIFSEFWIFYK